MAILRKLKGRRGGNEETNDQQSKQCANDRTGGDNEEPTVQKSKQSASNRRRGGNEETNDQKSKQFTNDRTGGDNEEPTIQKSKQSAGNRRRGGNEEGNEKKLKQCANDRSGGNNEEPAAQRLKQCANNRRRGDNDETNEQKSERCAHDEKAKGNLTTHLCDTDRSESDSINLESKILQRAKTKRGRTQLARLQRQRVQGIKKDVVFNRHGRPIGESGTEMQSYIGVLTREKVKITYKSWNEVPRDVKELIWLSVNLTYNVDPKWKKGCLRSANDKWRQWKTHLTQHVVLKHINEPEKLKHPPSGLSITLSDWSAFVSSRMSQDFLKLSAKQKEIRKNNIYPHRLSRKGYAGLAETIKQELCDDEEVDRAILWKKARLNKEGEYEGKELQEAVNKIDDYIQQKAEGAVNVTIDDVLSTVLGTAEHAGHVRAVAGDITPPVYVSRSKGKKLISQDMMNEREIELMELKKINSEQNARIEKLEAMVRQFFGQNLQIDGNGSCLEKLQYPSNEDDSKTEKSFSKDEESDDDLQIIDKADIIEGKTVALTLEFREIVVAYGTIVAVNNHGSKLHGAPFPENCVRISIDEAVEESASLPNPIPGECETIGDALGSHVAWPSHLIMTSINKPARKRKDDQEKKIILPTSMPASLKMLYCYCKHALDNGRSILMHIDDEVFDGECEINIHLEDINPFCEMEPISCNCIAVYIWHLYRKIKEENHLDKFKFVNPYVIPHESTAGKEKDWIVERLDNKGHVLADRLISAIKNQLVLVPCNIGFHWILTVIDPYKEVVYLLDPLGLRIRDLDWKYVVDKAIKMFNVEKGRKGKKQPTWKIVSCPLQPDTKQCGFYVLRYMRQIVEEVATIRMDSLLLLSIVIPKEFIENFISIS